MQVEIMEDILGKLNKQLVREEQQVILFMDNATVHPESLDRKFSNKNTAEKYNISSSSFGRRYYPKL